MEYWLFGNHGIECLPRQDMVVLIKKKNLMRFNMLINSILPFLFKSK